MPPPPPPPPPPPSLAPRPGASPSPPPPPPPNPHGPPPPPNSAHPDETSPRPPPPPPPPPPLPSSTNRASDAPAPPPPVVDIAPQVPAPPTPNGFIPSAPPQDLVPSAPPLTPTPSSPPPAEPIPRLPIMTRGEPSPSSPRRPRRAGTGVPPRGSLLTASELAESVERSARDEFEEEFLSRGRETDREGQIINQHLDGVDFHQLDDDEEVLSDDAADPRRGEAAARRVAEQQNRSDELDTVELRRVRQSTVRSNWKRIPSEVGCEGCEGCGRLCDENKKLRRQLDELEFELASGVLHNPADGFDPPQVVKAVPAIPQIPVAKKGGWTSRLKNSTTIGGGAKPSEKARLRSEVKALTVTTEYLWRKLNKAEMELRNYRLKDLRNRMKMDGELSASSGVPQQNNNVRSADWEWE